jgi:hypothetical protein
MTCSAAFSNIEDLDSLRRQFPFDYNLADDLQHPWNRPKDVISVENDNVRINSICLCLWRGDGWNELPVLSFSVLIQTHFWYLATQHPLPPPSHLWFLLPRILFPALSFWEGFGHA